LVAQSDPAGVLQGAQDGAVSNSKSRLVTDQPVTLNGHPGREYKMESQDGKYAATGRVYLVANRLYQLLVVAPEDKPQPENVAKFLESFTLLGE
jgi:hypothetical protein